MADLLERARARGRREAAIQRPAQTLERQEDEDRTVSDSDRPAYSTASDSDRPAYSTGSDSDRPHADPTESGEQSHPQKTKNQPPHQTRDSKPTSQPGQPLQPRKWLLNWADPKLHTTVRIRDDVVEAMSPEERAAYHAFWRRMDEERRKKNFEPRS
jgi:hypothetical protein